MGSCSWNPAHGERGTATVTFNPTNVTISYPVNGLSALGLGAGNGSIVIDRAERGGYRISGMGGYGERQGRANDSLANAVSRCATQLPRPDRDTLNALLPRIRRPGT